MSETESSNLPIDSSVDSDFSEPDKFEPKLKYQNNHKINNLMMNKNGSSYTDDHFVYELANITEVTKKLTDVEEDEDEGESCIEEEEKWASSTKNPTPKVNP